MRTIIPLVVLVFLASRADSLACQPNIAPVRKEADSQLQYKGKLRVWGSGGGRIYTNPVDEEKLNVWTWDGSVLKQDRSSGDSLTDWYVTEFAVGDGECFRYRVGTDGAPSMLELVEIATGRLKHEWSMPSGWWTRVITQARNGAYAGLLLEERGGSYKAYHLKLGLYNSTTETLKWCCVLSDKPAGMIMRQGLPSDDGKYIAVAAWKNGMAMVDVEQGKMLWEKRPRDEVSTNCLAFSGDSRFLFSSGSEGAVYTMDVKTGDILRKSMASLSGESEYGHRVVCLAASPDGRFVAAGTGPKGLVFLFEASTGKLLEVLDHGGSTVLVVGFSPDSSALASLAAGQIKVWKMPASQAATTQKAKVKAADKKKPERRHRSADVGRDDGVGVQRHGR